MSSPHLSAATATVEAISHDPYAALRLPSYRLYWGGNLIAMLGMQMQKVAVLWEIYQRTGDAFDLGLVGLVQFLPVLILGLPAGQLADRYDRKKIIIAAMGMLVLGSLGLAVVSLLHGSLWLMYSCLFLNAVARALQQPAKASMLPFLVPRERFSNAVTWNSGAFQLASVLGPSLAGLLLAASRSAALIYLLEAGATLTFLVVLIFVVIRPQIRSAETDAWKAFAAGLKFVWNTKVVLGAITLDLFAVIFGGATTLLPIFAKEILEVGATGLGWLWAAPALGAILTSLVLAHHPPMKKAGRALLWSVAGFGLATIGFGLSRSYWVSLLMLLLTGAFDTVSVVVRHTLVQLLTPDEMRGRVSAVNGIFISASNGLSEFESGVVADLFDRPYDPEFGPTVSVVTGGLGTLAVVGFLAFLWPELRQHGRLDEAPEAKAAA